MDDARKTKAALIDELRRLRAKVKKLESVGQRRATAGKPTLTIARAKASGTGTTSPSVQWADRYRDLFENSDTGITIVDKEGRFLLANKMSAAAFGKSPEDVIGKSMFDLLPRDTAARYLELNRQLLETGGDREYEDTFTLPTGIRSFLILDHCLTDEHGRNFAIQGSSIDITERKRVEEMQQATEKRFRALIEKSSDVISLLAADGTILYESPAALRILGYAVEELKGRNAFELIHPDDLHAITELFAPLVQTPNASVSSQVRFRHKDGSWRWLDMVGTNLLAEPSVQAIIVNYRDITERKQAQEALRETNEHLEIRVQERTVKLEQANRALEAEITERKAAEEAVKRERQRISFARQTGRPQSLWFRQ